MKTTMRRPEYYFEVILDAFELLINDRRRAEQPDWNGLSEKAHALYLASRKSE